MLTENPHFSPDSTRAEQAIGRLSDFKKRFDPILFEFFAQEIEEAKFLRPELVEFLRVGAEFAFAGGKRLRPAFMFYGYKAAGGTDEDALVRSSISVELVHTGALVHDDIIDHSDLRRGSPTVHKVFTSKLGDSEMGSSIALLAGDTVFALAGKAISRFPNSGGVVKARQMLDEMCLEINLGQYLDVLGSRTKTPDRDWIMKVMEFKTARYTVEKPLLIGASLGGATAEVLRALSKYGIPLGIAFQVQDDILGMFGDEEKVGKPADSDLKEGKKTLLVLKTTEVLEEAERNLDLQRFRVILGNPNLTPEDYRWVQSLMLTTGAYGYCREVARELITNAKDTLDGIEMGKEAKDYLLGIADFMLEREY